MRDSRRVQIGPRPSPAGTMGPPGSGKQTGVKGDRRGGNRDVVFSMQFILRYLVHGQALPIHHQRGNEMNGSPSRHAFALRQRPLALCLACALGTGTATGALAANAAGPSATGPGRPDTPRLRAPRITGPADLPASSPVRAAWEQWLAHPPPARPAATIPVTNCNDSGTGSLRDAVTNAVDGDTIDMTALTCSTITLTTGSLTAFADNLTLDGPGSKYLAVDGNYAYTSIQHIGTGLLDVSGVTLENGHKYGSSPRGGCLFSGGTVQLSDVVATNCATIAEPGYSYPALGGAVYAAYNLSLDNSAVTYGSVFSTGTSANGGGIFAGGNITMSYSNVSHNTATSNGNGASVLGGGIYSSGTLSLTGSSVDNNTAYGKYSNTRAIGGGAYAKSALTSLYSDLSNNRVGASGPYAWGGGATARYGGLIKYSTIVANESSHNIGGLYMGGSSGALTIDNSTISGNYAANVVGGVDSFIETGINSSTIAFNEEATNGAYSYTVAAGVNVGSSTLTLQSSIIAQNADNEFSYTPSDLSGNSATVSGANNLIRYSYLTVPGDTITFTDPLLLPLAYNGGPTRTHALSMLSPAIDAGNNVYGFDYDQRGDGYPRVIGANADIGAFEGVSSDEIFGNGFDP